MRRSRSLVTEPLPAPTAREAAPLPIPVTRSANRSAIGGFSDDSFALNITARARWIRLADGSPIHEEELRYRSDTASFAAWSDRRGKTLERSADYGFRVLAEQVVRAARRAES